MSRKISNHIQNHAVSRHAAGAVFMLSPSGKFKFKNGITGNLVRSAINSAAQAHGEDTLVEFNSWEVTSSEIFEVIESLPKHFKENENCFVHVMFVCHGSAGKLHWNNNKCLQVDELLSALKNLQFKQLESVSLLSCQSLTNATLYSLPFDIVGFTDDIYWDELPHFVTRLIKEYSAGMSFKKSVQVAIKSCSHSSLTRLSRRSVVFRSCSK